MRARRKIRQPGCEQLLELVLQQQAEIARLRAETELLKQRPPQSGAPFSKNKPKCPGRKPGEGFFQRRAAPAPKTYSAPPTEVFVTETECPACAGELGAEREELVTVTELPEIPQMSSQPIASNRAAARNADALRAVRIPKSRPIKVRSTKAPTPLSYPD